MNRLLCGRLQEGGILASSFADGLIHQRCDPVIVMAGDKLGERSGIHFAARDLQSRRQSFRVREHVVGDRDGCFHTESITARAPSARPLDRLRSAPRSQQVEPDEVDRVIVVITAYKETST